MKTKLVFMFVMASLFVTTLSAQVRVGVDAGANASKFVGKGSSPAVKGDWKLGYQIGVNASYEFQNHWMLLSGLSFIQRSGDLQLGVYDATGNVGMIHPKVATKINYLQVPLKVGYNIHISNRFSLIPNAGLYAAYGWGAGACDLKTGSGSVSTTWKPLQGKPEYGLEPFRRWDWGGTAGVKAVVNQHYTIDLNYSLGILKAQTDYSLRNSTFQLSVGYLF